MALVKFEDSCILTNNLIIFGHPNQLGSPLLRSNFLKLSCYPIRKNHGYLAAASPEFGNSPVQYVFVSAEYEAKKFYG